MMKGAYKVEINDDDDTSVATLAAASVTTVVTLAAAFRISEKKRKEVQGEDEGGKGGSVRADDERGKGGGDPKRVRADEAKTWRFPGGKGMVIQKFQTKRQHENPEDKKDYYSGRLTTDGPGKVALDPHIEGGRTGFVDAATVNTRACTDDFGARAIPRRIRPSANESKTMSLESAGCSITSYFGMSSQRPLCIQSKKKF